MTLKIRTCLSAWLAALARWIDPSPRRERPPMPTKFIPDRGFDAD